jgi:hypothetical protein
MLKITQTGQEGILQLVGFHDGHLKGQRINSDGSLLLWCSDIRSSKYSILVPKIEWLRIDGFTGANIINAILLYEARHCPIDLFTQVRFLDLDVYKSVLQTKFEEFKSTTMIFLEIATSDGCSVLAIFKGPVNTIQINSLDKTNAESI